MVNDVIFLLILLVALWGIAQLWINSVLFVSMLVLAGRVIFTLCSMAGNVQ